VPEVTPLDPATVTVDSLGPWWDVALAGYAAHNPTVPLDPLAEFVAAQHADAVAGAMSRPLLAGVRDPPSGAPVGFLSGSLPQRENTHLLVLANLVVHPHHRRRGIGSALLAHAARVARADRRRVVSLTAVEPVGSDGADVAGTRFARAAGAVGTALEVRGTLRLPAGPTQPEPLSAMQPEPVAAGYELLTWVDATPSELVEQRIALAWRCRPIRRRSSPA